VLYISVLVLDKKMGDGLETKGFYRWAKIQHNMTKFMLNNVK